MYNSKYSLLCLLAIIGSPFINQAAEKTYSIEALMQQTPANAMSELADIIKQHKEDKTPYENDELMYAECLIALNKDHINTLMPSNNRGFARNNLGLAVMYGQPAMVKLLLKHGARVTAVTNHTDMPDCNALWLCPADNIEIFTDLLAADPNVENTINSPYKDGETILHDVLLSTSDILEALRSAGNTLDNEELNKLAIDIIKHKTCWLMYYGANPKVPDNGNFNQNRRTAFDIVNLVRLIQVPGRQNVFNRVPIFPAADRQDILGILHKGRESSLPLFLREHMLIFKGNTASYIHNRQITGPWKGAQKITYPY